MAFQDEELIAQRTEAKRMRNYTIENEVVVDGVAYQFARRKLFEDNISIGLSFQKGCERIFASQRISPVAAV